VIDEGTMLLAAPPKVAPAAHPAAIGGVRPEPPPDDEPPTGEEQVRSPNQDQKAVALGQMHQSPLHQRAWSMKGCLPESLVTSF
jgi:hypothetical protein